MIEASSHCEDTFKAQLAAGISADDFSQNVDVDELVEEITVSGWAMNVGYEQVLRVQQSRQIIEGTASLMAPLDATDPLVRSMVRLINSYPWKQKLSPASISNTISLLTVLQFR